ncbi:MAG TPA: hypothetical protein VKW76_08165 [Candidatus Binatia bacterium]|nr:hypothetical protein [Candidatus Binatia bacterium]
MAVRFVSALAAILLLGGLPSNGMAKKRPRAPRGLGVFATIKGKRFKAPSIGLGDRCVVATYLPASGGVIVSAGQCRRVGRRQVPKHNPKLVALVCGVASATSPPVPPFDAPCLTAGYTEIRTGRFGQIVSQNQWTASTSFALDTNGTVVESSSVTAHVTSFDGTYVRGTFTGVFDTAHQAAGPAAVAIDGAGSFYLAVRIGN